ncbi:MAG: AAA-like domain-containing protein [Cyanobacteria bacterium P01_F01_bin.150]
MVVDEALSFLDEILSGQPLSTIQETVFRQVWDGKTYAEIAETAGYEHSYVRDVGFKLWQSMSDALGEKVSKSNVRSLMGRYARQRPLSAASPTPRPHSNRHSDQHSNQSSKQRSNQLHSQKTLPSEYPSGPVPLGSPFYIERQPTEARVHQEINKPGSLVRLKGHRQSGKTSMLLRLVQQAKQEGYATVFISLHKADRDVLTNLDKFLRWLCANVSRQLQLAPKLDQYWDLDIGSKVSCTAYFEEYMLENITTPIVIVLDEVNQIFEYPDISRDFLPLLRSWYEDAKEGNRWQSIRWVISHCTNIYVPLRINQSPFNVGLAVQLPEFSDGQILDLAQRHGFEWAFAQNMMSQANQSKTAVEALPVQPLVRMVGHRASLVRLALYHLQQPGADLDELVETAPTLHGIFGSHLRSQLMALHSEPELAQVYHHLVCVPEETELNALTAYRLENMGLITIHGSQVIPACDLYRIFFQTHLIDFFSTAH